MLNCNYPAGRFYHRAVTSDQDPPMRSDKIGWNTDEISRQQLISGLDEALRQSSILVYDPTTIQELLWFIINPRGRAEAQPGCHDDCVLALALMVVVMARMPRPRPPAENLPAPKIGYYNRPPSDPDARGTRVKLSGGKWVKGS